MIPTTATVTTNPHKTSSVESSSCDSSSSHFRTLLPLSRFLFCSSLLLFFVHGCLPLPFGFLQEFAFCNSNFFLLLLSFPFQVVSVLVQPFSHDVSSLALVSFIASLLPFAFLPITFLQDIQSFEYQTNVLASLIEDLFLVLLDTGLGYVMISSRAEDTYCCFDGITDSSGRVSFGSRALEIDKDFCCDQIM